MIKKIFCSTMVFLMAFTILPTKVFAEDFNEIVTIEENNVLLSRKIDASGNYGLKPKESFNKKFKMDGILGGQPHNAVSIVIKPSIGTVVVEVTGDNGYSYTSSNITADTTVTVSNCKTGVNYTVTVKNPSAVYAADGKYSMTSFIK